MTDESISVRTHDNVDADLIRINKDKLKLLFMKCAGAAVIPNETLTYGGFALTFATAAFLTESFHNFWFIPGETIRAVFVLGAITLAIVALFRLAQWIKMDGGYSPEAIVERLAPSPTAKPQLLLPSPNIEPPKKKNARASRLLSRQHFIQTE